MVEYSDEVKTLAETLKNSGLAASMIDALERAQTIIGGTMSKPKEEVVKEPIKEPIKEPVKETEDVAQTTLEGEGNTEVNLSGIKAVEASESIEIEEGLKEEEVFTEKTEQKQESNQDNTQTSQQKKIDLTEIFNVNK